MRLEVPNLLSPADLAQVRQAFAVPTDPDRPRTTPSIAAASPLNAPSSLAPPAPNPTLAASSNFVDGKTTAGWNAKLVKNNTQLSKQSKYYPILSEILKKAILQQDLIKTACRPQQVHSLLFSRYTAGMDYGSHVDNALMGQWRSDISFTLFLSDPASYGGGELVLEGSDREDTYKLAENTVFLYPSSFLHRVNPVTSGVRLAAVGWIQSWVRDPQQREILFDIDVVRRSIFAQQGKTTEFDLLSKSISNLLRLWSE